MRLSNELELHAAPEPSNRAQSHQFHHCDREHDQLEHKQRNVRCPITNRLHAEPACLFLPGALRDLVSGDSCQSPPHTKTRSELSGFTGLRVYDLEYHFAPLGAKRSMPSTKRTQLGTDRVVEPYALRMSGFRSNRMTPNVMSRRASVTRECHAPTPYRRKLFGLEEAAS